MMEKPIRVLHVLGTTNLGGAESRIMELYRNIDRNKIMFDFLTHTGQKGYFDDEIHALGGEIYHLPRFSIYNLAAYKKACRTFFTDHPEYAVVHGHMTSTASIYLPAAKKYAHAYTVAHARSAGVDKGPKGMITKILRHSLHQKADVLLACSDFAAEAVFGKKSVDSGNVIILPNAVDTKCYSFREDLRKEMRAGLSVEDRFVIGHVGRFHYAKNHEYLLDIFEQIRKKRKDAILLLLGDGPLREQTEKKAEMLGIKKDVIFCGNCVPTMPYYQAMDVFIFPSRFEGMPGTVVEAQAAGLPCLISDRITQQVRATDLVSFYSIEEDPRIWAEGAIASGKNGYTKRNVDLSDSLYDVKNQVKRYEEFYQKKDAAFLRLETGS